jgi:acetyl esterase/lipase
METKPRIESLLSARLFQSPQIVGDRLYFVSNLGGWLSLYVMDYGGSVPEPLLPPDIALQNPHHVPNLFYAFPAQGQIVLMLDQNGDENYQPMTISIDGGYPAPAFPGLPENYRWHMLHADPEANIVYLVGESRAEQLMKAYRAHLDTGELEELYASQWGGFPAGHDAAHHQATVLEGYSSGDTVLYLVEPGAAPVLLYGTPLADRSPGQDVPLNGLAYAHFAPSGEGLLVQSSVHDDTYGPGYLDFAQPHIIAPVGLMGLVHEGMGELEALEHLGEDRYSLQYNIDGSTWLYEAAFDEAARQLTVTAVICGRAPLADGVLDHAHYDREGDRWVLAHSTATSPTQIYTVEGPDRDVITQHTRERVLGLDSDWLSPGEDASYTSFDGLRISARLYRPSPALGYEGPRPLVFYVHGGPQSQERPDFAWFSMPLIQYLTLNGFTVFVPNVRGSSGYGLSYMKHVDRDWGGNDRLDHVHALSLLADDPDIDTSRAAVMGRSYGGYMTLTLAARHPELWSAAVDMFGPYDLYTFIDRLPETWKPYFALTLGEPGKDDAFLIERSPKTYIDQITCPMLVIQGANDPRVIEQESADVVEQLRAAGKEVEYLMFPDEGHDVLKYANRVRCYTEITEFFRRHLMPNRA